MSRHANRRSVQAAMIIVFLTVLKIASRLFPADLADNRSCFFIFQFIVGISTALGVHLGCRSPVLWNSAVAGFRVSKENSRLPDEAPYLQENGTEVKILC